MGRFERGPLNKKAVIKQIREMFSEEEATRLINKFVDAHEVEALIGQFQTVSSEKGAVKRLEKLRTALQSENDVEPSHKNKKDNNNFGNKYSRIIKISAESNLVIPATYEKWPGKLKTKESLTSFFRRVWGQHIRDGLTMAHIRQLDKKLYNAIFNWKSRERKEWPSDLLLPTQSDTLLKNLEEFQSGEYDLPPKALLSVIRKIDRDSRKKITSEGTHRRIEQRKSEKTKY